MNFTAFLRSVCLHDYIMLEDAVLHFPWISNASVAEKIYIIIFNFWSSNEIFVSDVFMFAIYFTLQFSYLYYTILCDIFADRNSANFVISFRVTWLRRSVGIHKSHTSVSKMVEFWSFVGSCEDALWNAGYQIYQPGCDGPLWHFSYLDFGTRDIDLYEFGSFLLRIQQYLSAQVGIISCSHPDRFRIGSCVDTYYKLKSSAFARTLRVLFVF